MDYTIIVKGEQKGPYTLSQIESMWESGIITSDGLYWSAKTEHWEPINELIESQNSPPPVVNEPPPPVINAPIPPEPKKSFWPSYGGGGCLILIVLVGVFFSECVPTMEETGAEIKVEIGEKLSSLSNSGIQITEFELSYDAGARYVGYGKFMFREVEGSFTMKVTIHDYPTYRTIIVITHPLKPEVTRIFRTVF